MLLEVLKIFTNNVINGDFSYKDMRSRVHTYASTNKFCHFVICHVMSFDNRF